MRRRRLSPVLTNGAVGALMMTGCGVAEASPGPLESAYNECHSVNWGGMDYDSEHNVMTFYAVYQQEDGELTQEGSRHALSWECAVNELEIPGHVRSSIASTTALQGRQSAEWDEFEAEWSYHPNSGMNLILESAD